MLSDFSGLVNRKVISSSKMRPGQADLFTRFSEKVSLRLVGSRLRYASGLLMFLAFFLWVLHSIQLGAQAKADLVTPKEPPFPGNSFRNDEVKNSICSPLVNESLAELGGLVSAPYAPPPAGSDARHHGVDFAYYRRKGRLSIAGAAVQAILPGRLAAVIKESFPYGNLVIVETPSKLLSYVQEKAVGIHAGESLYTLYAHLDTLGQIERGGWVSACDLIGTVGRSGNAGQAHLHLETRLGPVGSDFYRMGCYHREASLQERAAYHLWRTSGAYRHFDPMILLVPAMDN